LKLLAATAYADPPPVSPGCPAGGGLKLAVKVSGRHPVRVSPGCPAGGGLKPENVRNCFVGRRFPPAARPGAD